MSSSNPGAARAAPAHHLGRACGADGYGIEKPADLAAALRTAVQRRRPAVLDVPMTNEPVPTPGHLNIKDIYHGVFE